MLRREFLQHLAFAATATATAPVLGQTPPTRTRTPPRVMPGIDVLAAEGFSRIRGLRVGLVTHSAGLGANGQRTPDILRNATGVNLVRLFAPEHGIDGKAPADATVQNTTDKRTGLPVHSLYGKTRRPTTAMLAGLDAVLVDLQDIGTRSYTYVSCARYVLEACFEAGIRVIVLDRPNPLGGLKVDGPGIDKKWMSYVGAYPVPYVHGLTIGELALAATRTPGWLSLTAAGRRNGRLEIVKMRGWTRSMRWRDTGLRWTPTSPMIQYIDAAEGYPMTGLGCQLGAFSHGAKTNHPFRFIQYRGKRAREIERALLLKNIRGLGIRAWRLHDGTEGVYLFITHWDTLRPTEISFHMMQLACLWGRPNPFANATPSEKDLFNKHTGSEAFFNDLCKRGATTDITAWLDRWTRDAQAFQKWSRQFWLYP
ncbi:MAG: DUF1343 domain-containing protein [Puniceicoccales bacterium]|jgi:uncharacterized protein YbbC (DUF1343 family)|nr:DUF1343 domain-containing protein [Puniceicoccales bacterium]